MTDRAAPKRVAILGGGIAALAAAFEITSTPGHAVTIHTLGWRLGGKCASSRGPDGRIKERGIHGFLGSYYNAMPMLAAVYAELNRSPTAPLATFEPAVFGIDTVQLYAWDGTQANRFDAHIRQLPGRRTWHPTPWSGPVPRRRKVWVRRRRRVRDPAARPDPPVR